MNFIFLGSFGLLVLMLCRQYVCESNKDNNLLAPPIKQTQHMNQIIRYAQSTSLPKISLLLNNLIFWNPSRDPLCPNFGWISGTQTYLKQLIQSRKFCVILLASTKSFEEESDIMRLLTESGCISPIHTRRSTDTLKILFIKSSFDRIFVLTAIKSHAHIESFTRSTLDVAKVIQKTIVIQNQNHSSKTTLSKTYSTDSMITNESYNSSLSFGPSVSGDSAQDTMFITEEHSPNIVYLNSLTKFDYSQLC